MKRTAARDDFRRGPGHSRPRLGAESSRMTPGAKNFWGANVWSLPDGSRSLPDVSMTSGLARKRSRVLEDDSRPAVG
jgi:hypothetical protein